MNFLTVIVAVVVAATTTTAHSVQRRLDVNVCDTVNSEIAKQWCFMLR
jgi:hypothetical protein